MIGLIKFLQKRPTDKVILSGRVIFGLTYIAIMYYNLFYLTGKTLDNSYIFGLISLNTQWVEILKYVFTAIGIVPVIMWITNICMLKKKYLKIIQIIFGFFLFYIAGSISIENNASLDFDFVIWMMWVLPLLAGITGKCITSKCLRYWEKITKIRV